MPNRFSRRFLGALLGLMLGTPFVSVAQATDSTREYTLELYDSARRRIIPLALYIPAETRAQTGVVLFNHGYGGNDPNAARSYTYLTRELALRGYLVISVQHEQPGDPPLAMEGELRKTRLENWERGVENMLFAIERARRIWPSLDWPGLSVIGHSNGGDMTLLLATRHPEKVHRAISLDHRRMPMPRTDRPQLSSLRGCDYEADPGVLPPEEACRRYGIRLIRYEDISHGDMDDKGSTEKHERICRDVLHLMQSPN